MATRSGKPYHHGNKRKRSSLQDTTMDNNNTLNGNEVEDNLNISGMSTRELRGRKTQVKDSNMDKGDMPVAKIQPGHATESNWIISSVSKKVKRKGAKENVEKEPENDINASNVITKPLKRRKSNVAENNVENIDQINTTFEKDKEINKLGKEKASKKGKENVRKDGTFNKSELSEIDDVDGQKDMEVDLNADNVVGKQSKKKKKKVKGSKKKKQKIKAETDSLGSADNKIDNDSKNTSSDNNKIIAEKAVDVNSPKVSKKLLRSRTTNIKDVYEKPKIVNTTIEKDEIINKTYEKEFESDDTSSVNSKEMKSGVNVTYEKNNDTFEKDISTSFDTFKKGAISRKSSIRDRSNTSIVSLTREDFENDKDIISSSATKRKSVRRHTVQMNDLDTEKLNSTLDKSSNKGNFVKYDVQTDNVSLLSHAAKRKSVRRQTIEINDSDTQKLNSTFDKTSNNRQSLVKGDIETDRLSLSSPASKRKSLRRQTIEINDFDTQKLNSTFDKTSSSQSLVNADITADKVSLLSPAKRKSVRRQTIEINDSDSQKLNSTFEKTSNNKSLVKDDIETIKASLLSPASKRKSLRRQTIEINDSDSQKLNSTFEKTSNNNLVKEDIGTVKASLLSPASKRKSLRRQTIEINESPAQKLDSTYDKTNSRQSLVKDDLEGDSTSLSSPASKRKSLRRQTVDLNNSATTKLDSTFDKPLNNEIELKRKSQRLSEAATEQKLNATFEKETVQADQVSKSSLISSDNSVSDKSEISRISITSDDTVEDIGNTTPVLIESSMEVSLVKDSPKPQTPMKREGTFTKDGPEVQPQSPVTPSRRTSSIISQPGCTPYHVGKSSQKKPLLNVTRSIEKRKSIDPAPRLTRVMFCSPVDNPALMTTEKRKIIKSNLKGSNKSFVYEESASVSRAGRKRSYTQSDAEDSRAKRSRLTSDLQQSVNRLSRPRTTSAAAKLTDTTPKKGTPFRSKSESKPVRTRLPNFAALHQKQFDKMESLDECQERKARRAKQMLTPTGSTNLLERISPKNDTEPQKPATKDLKPKDKTDTPSKKYTLESLRPGFTRFGFKLNLDVPNPFTIPPKTDKKDKPNGLARPVALPSLTGATSTRREVAKQMVMREKSFLEKKRNMNRSENRTIIKGVRTNRRFELQMKLRNID